MTLVPPLSRRHRPGRAATTAAWLALCSAATLAQPAAPAPAASAPAVPAAAAPAQPDTAAPVLTFSQAVQAARQHDAAFRVAGLERDAARFNIPIARASLLPSAAITAAESSVRGSRSFANAQNQEVQLPLDYRAPQASLNVRMPLYNPEANAQLRQAHELDAVAEAAFRAQGLDLLDRLATAYLQVVLAREAAAVLQAQVQTLQTQLAQSRQRMARGEGTRVQVAQNEALLEVASSREKEAVDQVELAQRQLARLTGLPEGRPGLLPAEQGLPPLVPQTLQGWQEIALAQSPLVQGRERAVQAARAAVQRQQAGHLPRLELVGSLSRNQNDSTSNVGQNTQVRSVGVQLTVPLFNGGGVEASVKQSEVRLQQAEEEWRDERLQLEVEVMRLFLAARNGGQKAEAQARAVSSTELAWQGARRALELGVGTQAEVAETQAQHFLARRDLAQARVDELIARVRLRLRAGFTTEDVSRELDALLMPAPRTPAGGTPR